VYNLIERFSYQVVLPGQARSDRAYNGHMNLISWPDDKLPHKVSGGRVLCWASLIEPDTLDQCKRLAGLSFVQPHVAIMPDAHLGKGAAIGSVVPTVDAVIPSAVGVDLGCGMIAVKTNVSSDEIDFWVKQGHSLESLRDAIEEAIPLSAGNYNKGIARYPFTARKVADLTNMAADDTALSFNGFDNKPLRNCENWPNQLGTLGGGNHFIELSLDESGTVWLFLHSGSRGVGNALATKWIKRAADMAAKWHIQVSPDLAYLPCDTDDFDQYLAAVQWAQHFALLNREEMMDRFMAVFSEWLEVGGKIEVERINCHHNYISRENHFGKNLWVTRKGAIDAYDGVSGVIPGSMGTPSYVVRGKGCRASLCSAPHGAGRLYGRRAAKEQFTEADLAAQMGSIVYRHGAAWVDEIPSAYKPIEQVMKDADQLVEPVAVLRQLLNVKGT
jgi:tRNA-splicing ligase RtcB